MSTGRDHDYIPKPELLVLIARPIGWQRRGSSFAIVQSAGLDHMGRIASGEVLDQPLWECQHRHVHAKTAQQCAARALRAVKRAWKASGRG